MADGRSRLNKEEKSQLKQLLRCRELSLLYKGSIHTYNANVFHNICNRQGPTVVVAYNASGYIFGAYTSQSYTSSGYYINDKEAFLFRLKGKTSDPLKIPVKVPAQAVYDVSGYGPYFGAGSIVFLLRNNAAVATNSSVATYKFCPEDLHGNDQVLVECEVYRVEDVGDFMETPWRMVEWSARERWKLKNEIVNFKTFLKSVPQYRVLLVGPVGAGKSSFFNSVNSIFLGYVRNQAIAGSDSTSVTLQNRTYGVKNKNTGKPLPVLFCDTIGLEEKQGAGLDIHEVENLLKGDVRVRYQFNRDINRDIDPDMYGYTRHLTMKQQIHCIVFVIDCPKLEMLPEKLEEKLKDIQRKAVKFVIKFIPGVKLYKELRPTYEEQLHNFIIHCLSADVPQVVLLTKVDKACPLLEENISYVYRSKAVQRQMKLIEGKLGIPLNQIFPVKNYSSELELRNDVDILILMAVKQLLHSSDTHLHFLQKIRGGIFP